MNFQIRKSYILLLIIIFMLSFSLLGCSLNNNNQVKNDTKDNKEITEIEKAKLSIKAATLIAEEKLTFIFYTYTPEESETVYYITKDGYKNLDDIRKYLNSYYTPGMTDSLIARYMNVEDVPKLGKRPILQLPDDFITYRKHQENDKKDEIKIDGNNASLIFYENDKKITYTFIKQNNKWLIDTKIVE